MAAGRISIASGMIVGGQLEGPAVVSTASILSEEYGKFLREVRVRSTS
jgi:hypothetical protein